jgi:NADH:ubiquinone oxidoreductase subunit D
MSTVFSQSRSTLWRCKYSRPKFARIKNLTNLKKGAKEFDASIYSNPAKV